MGFFSKLKQNFSHGDVKLQLQAPNTVSQKDPNFSATVTITNAGQAPQTIKTIKVSLVEDRTRPVDPNNTATNGGEIHHEVASATQNGPLVIDAGESKSFSLAVPMNVGKDVQSILPDNAAVQAAANVLSKVEETAEALSTQKYRYFIQAVADVDGITFDPTDRAEVQVLKPNQIGGSIHPGN